MRTLFGSRGPFSSIMRNKQLRLFLFSLLIFSCSKTETPEIPLKKHPIKAEVYGCRSFSKDKTCGFLKEDPFKVWVKTPPGAKIKIFLNNKEVDSFLEKRMILAGHFFKFKVTENTSLLKIQSFLPKSRGTWLLKLKAFNNSPSLEKAQKLKKSGKKMDARSLLKSFLSGQITDFQRAKA